MKPQISTMGGRGEGGDDRSRIDIDGGGGGDTSGCDPLRSARPRYPWPAVPSTRLGSPLVKIGCSFVEQARSSFLKEMDGFLDMYKNRPVKRNKCGMRVNHSYALWLTVKNLQPEYIIESGVNAGQSTYIFRTAAPNAKIFCIDPRDKPLCREARERWIDQKNATYFTGDDFKDFQDIDWGSMIARGEIDPAKTLVFLDDHTYVFRRFSTLMRHGFRHVILEDNYRPGEGDTIADKRGWCMKQMLSRVDPDSEFLYRTLASYAEYPPLVPPAVVADVEKNVRKVKKPKYLHVNDTLIDVAEPLLRPDIEGNIEDKKIYERLTREFGINPKLEDDNSYLEIMMYQQIAYFEVLPLAPHLALDENWK